MCIRDRVVTQGGLCPDTDRSTDSNNLDITGVRVMPLYIFINIREITVFHFW